MSNTSHAVAAPCIIRQSFILLSSNISRAASGFISRFISSAAICFLITAMAASAPGQSGDPKADLQQKVSAQFTFTTITADRSDIVTPGSIVVLQKNGLSMIAVASPMPTLVTYKKGKLSEGFGAGLLRAAGTGTLLGLSGSSNTTFPQRTFAAGEKLWIVGAVVKDDGVFLQLYSDPYDSIRYYSQVRIPFSKKNVYPSTDDLLKSISEVITVQPADNATGSAPPVSSKTETSALPPVPPPAPMAAIAPPPPPADQPPPTIKLGETKEQVVAAFGQPQRVVDLGTKEIDYYPGMKVTLVQGKVTDVQ